MRTPIGGAQFRRDVKLAQKRGRDMAKLRELIRLLIEGKPLPARYKDHPLGGEWSHHRDCHIEPDWLLSIRWTAPTSTWSEEGRIRICSDSRSGSRPRISLGLSPTQSYPLARYVPSRRRAPGGAPHCVERLRPHRRVRPRPTLLPVAQRGRRKPELRSEMRLAQARS